MKLAASRSFGVFYIKTVRGVAVVSAHHRRSGSKEPRETDLK